MYVLFAHSSSFLVPRDPAWAIQRRSCTWGIYALVEVGAVDWQSGNTYMSKIFAKSDKCAKTSFSQKTPTQDDVKKDRELLPRRQFPSTIDVLPFCMSWEQGQPCPGFSLQGCLLVNTLEDRDSVFLGGKGHGCLLFSVIKSLSGQRWGRCVCTHNNRSGSPKSGCLQRIEQAVCLWTAPFSCLGLDEQQKPRQACNSAACCAVSDRARHLWTGRLTSSASICATAGLVSQALHHSPAICLTLP